MSNLETTQETENEEVALLPHEEALYEYLGHEAADILHPKMESEPKVLELYREKTSTTLKAAIGSADMLWNNLRGDSRRKIKSQDDEKNRRIREAYDTYARDCVARKVVPIKRMDEPDDENFDDFEKVLKEHRAEKYLQSRRKKEVMFRQSHIHEDTFRVLTHNNPLPDFVNLTGEESIDRFLLRPSAAANNQASLDDDQYRVSRKYDEKELESTHSIFDEHLPPFLRRDLDENGRRKKRGVYYDLPYRLLESKPFRVDDRFSQRTRGEYSQSADPMAVMLKKLESRNKIRGRLDAMSAKSSVALPPLSTASRASAATRVPQSGKSVPVTLMERYKALKEMSCWEPLNLNALVEYKPTRRTVNPSHDPYFRFGRVSTWKANHATVCE